MKLLLVIQSYKSQLRPQITDPSTQTKTTEEIFTSRGIGPWTHQICIIWSHHHGIVGVMVVVVVDMFVNVSVRSGRLRVIVFFALLLDGLLLGGGARKSAHLPTLQPLDHLSHGPRVVQLARFVPQDVQVAVGAPFLVPVAVAAQIGTLHAGQVEVVVRARDDVVRWVHRRFGRLARLRWLLLWPLGHSLAGRLAALWTAVRLSVRMRAACQCFFSTFSEKIGMFSIFIFFSKILRLNETGLNLILD